MYFYLFVSFLICQGLFSNLFFFFLGSTPVLITLWKCESHNFWRISKNSWLIHLGRQRKIAGKKRSSDLLRGKIAPSQETNLSMNRLMWIWIVREREREKHLYTLEIYFFNKLNTDASSMFLLDSFIFIHRCSHSRVSGPRLKSDLKESLETLNITNIKLHINKIYIHIIWTCYS